MRLEEIARRMAEIKTELETRMDELTPEETAGLET